MPKIFSVVHLFTFKDEEIPAHFTFDVPVGGDYYFIQEGEDVFMYIEGRTEVATIQVEGQILSEGVEIPDNYETQTILGTIIDEELTWLIVVTKMSAHVNPVKNPLNEWRKKF